VLITAVFSAIHFLGLPGFFCGVWERAKLAAPGCPSIFLKSVIPLLGIKGMTPFYE